jgi:Zn-finger nucleic acid-binding protein
LNIPCCPHCGLLTLQARVGGAATYTCEECRGHYVAGASLHDYLDRHAGVRTFERLLQCARDAQPSTRDLKCPDCGTASYHEVRSQGVLIDACATCGSLYFDKGEANRYLYAARLRPTPNRIVDRIDDTRFTTEIGFDLLDLFD